MSRVRLWIKILRGQLQTSPKFFSLAFPAAISPGSPFGPGRPASVPSNYSNKSKRKTGMLLKRNTEKEEKQKKGRIMWEN